MMNRIAVFSSRKKLKKYERQILALAQRVFFFLRKGNVAVEFFLLDESQMRRINRRFGKKDKRNLKRKLMQSIILLKIFFWKYF